MIDEKVNDQPIGIFDSGIGGLTVLKKIQECFPHEHTIYLGDTARVPYGDKSPSTIIKYSRQNMSFLTTHHIKLLVIACNTASAFAVDMLRKDHSIPIVDVIEPAIEKALEISVNNRIAVLGTRATINSGIYPKKIREKCLTAHVFAQACPLFVPLVEEAFFDHPATNMIIQEYLKPLATEGIDTVILGCTHYPLLQYKIQEVLGPEVKIIDSASACAEKISDLLGVKYLKRTLLENAKREYYVTDDPERFQRLGGSLLGVPIECVNLSTY